MTRNQPPTLMQLPAFLVEDHSMVRENLIAALRELTTVVVVDTAEDERSAVAWLAEHHAEMRLVIVDIFLTSGTGLEVIRAVRELSPLLPVIALTNYFSPVMELRCLEQGASRVFDKSTQLESMMKFCNELAQAQQRS